MKTTAIIFTALLAVMTSAIVYANDGSGMTVISQKGSEIFKVIYKGGVSGKVRLNILDAQGKTIHTKIFAGLNGFILPVNFSGLQAGSYTIEVIDNKARYQEQVRYLPSSEMKSIHVSQLVREDGKYLLAVADAQDEAITIKIYDEKQRLVYNELKVLSGDFAQVYHIENTRGHYTFEVADSSGNRKYFNF